MSKPTLKSAPLPKLANDQEAEDFVDQADLADYDLSGFVPTNFEFEVKAAQLNMRLPQALLLAVKARASARGIPYTRFVREVLTQAVSA